MSLSTIWSKHPKRILMENFSLMPRIEKLYKIFSSKSLVATDMDEDQIWTQINEEVQILEKKLLKQLSKIERKATRIAEKEEEKQNQDEEQYQEEQIEEELEEEPYIEEEEMPKKALKNKKKQVQLRPKKQTINEEVDEFLKLERYLDDMDQKQADGEMESDIDDEDENDGDGNEQEDEGENGNENEENDEDLEQNDDDQNDEMENSIFDEMREAELEDKDEEIETLQNKMLSRKDWQMLGEVSSKARPLNSLLDEQLDFKANIAQHEQMITKEFQSTLEEKIRKRISDELWDDRQRNSLANAFQENFGSKREATELNHNKSQLGLAELMEHEFKNALGLPTNATEKNAKKELFNIFRDLCFKLDSLTNLSFQPRGFVKAGEIKVSSTIDREEKVPLTYTRQGTADVANEKLPRSFLSRAEATTQQKRARRNIKKQLGIKINKIKKAKHSKTNGQPSSSAAILGNIKSKKQVKDK